MKIIFDIFVLYSLTVIVRGAWWAAAVKPVILGFGAAFAAIELDIEPLPFLPLPSWLEKITKGKIKKPKP